MNLIVLKDILIYLGAFVSAVLSFALFLKKEDKTSKKVLKVLSIIVLILSIINAGFNFYMSSYENKLIHGNLCINVANPVVVNYNGVEIDEYVKDANFFVVSETSIFSMHTEIELKNLKTNEKFEYATDTIYQGFTITGFSSGKYRITINCDDYPTYTNVIELSTKNLKNGDWDFTAYYFDYFDSHSKELQFTITDLEVEKLQYFAFSIYADQCDIIRIFRTEIIDNKMKGEFYAIPNTLYSLNGGINTMDFDTKEIYLE